MATLPTSHRFPIGDTVYEAAPTPTSPTGMRGRQAVVEVMEMNAELERLTLATPISESEMWNAARKQGMLTMREDALQKAFAGRVPFSEVNTLSSMMLGAEDPVEESAAVHES
jgi:type II secretory ATPase GspE/PulE/Tfp pilus assembly ATPase PilB-like protein